MPGALAGVDHRRGNGSRPAEGPVIVDCLENGLGQRDLPAERRVQSVVKQVIVQQPVVADLVKVLLSIDQWALMTSGNRSINVLECGRACSGNPSISRARTEWR